MEEEADPSPVPWLGPFRLSAAVLFEGGLEVTHAPDALLPFAELRPEPGTMRFLPHPPLGPGIGESDAMRQALAAIPAGDRSRAARERRWVLGTTLAASEASAALRRLGTLALWQEAAAGRRAWYLRAVNAGLPPPAAEVAAAVRDVPHGLRHLGKALPTAEAVRLLAPLGRVCELGAGFGLFARALERAGVLVAASDPDVSGDAGIAFPVRKGFDAAATIGFFAERGPVPPLLMVWPQPEDGDWFARVFAGAAPGQLVAMASPEFEFCAGGGLEHAEAGRRPRPGWAAAAALAATLGSHFDEVGRAPVVAAGWPLATTPLRLWRRRG